MKQIKRILDEKMVGKLKHLLLKKRFKFRHRFGGYEEIINYYYTTHTVKKIHFLFYHHPIPNSGKAKEVLFHIDDVCEGYHKVSQNQHDYERILRWLDLPPELAFDLSDVFTTAKERWVAKRFRHKRINESGI